MKSNVQKQENGELWATIELMGHGQTAGKVEKPTEWGGLLRVDVPIENGKFRTEFYGIQSIYAIRFVSEEIARAFVRPRRDITIYDTPIVTREQYESTIGKFQQEERRLEERIRELERRLTAVKALPESNQEEIFD